MIKDFRSPKIYETTPNIRKGFYISPKFIIALVFLSLAGGLIYFVFLSPFFKVKEIIIEGAASQESIARLNKLKGRNILLLGSESIERKIKKEEPGIFSITIFRGIPDTLKIKIKDREAKLAWESQSNIFLIDEKGVAFSRPSASTEGLAIITDSAGLPIEDGQQAVSEEFVNFIINLKSNFTAKIGLGITRMQVGETTFNLEVFTDSGFRVFFDTTRDIPSQLEALSIILNEHRADIKEYIDVRVEGWGYYK